MEYYKAEVMDTAAVRVWLTDRQIVSDLGLSQEPATEGTLSKLTIVGADSVYEVENGCSILVERSGAKLLQYGVGRHCLVVENSLFEGVTDNTRPEPMSTALDNNDPTPTGRGDRAFIEACRQEGLPIPVINLGTEFLRDVRNFSFDELVEGKNRKWVTKPQNFLALTIQNRNQQFCVHVKKSKILESLTSVLDIRDDRPGYARFWLSDQNQLEAAVQAAKGSYGV